MAQGKFLVPEPAAPGPRGVYSRAAQSADPGARPEDRHRGRVALRDAAGRRRLPQETQGADPAALRLG